MTLQKSVDSEKNCIENDVFRFTILNVFISDLNIRIVYDNVILVRSNLISFFLRCNIPIGNYHTWGTTCVAGLVKRWRCDTYHLFIVLFFCYFIHCFLVRIDLPLLVLVLIFCSIETMYSRGTLSEFMLIYLFYEYFLIGELFLN